MSKSQSSAPSTPEGREDRATSLEAAGSSQEREASTESLRKRILPPLSVRPQPVLKDEVYELDTLLPLGSPDASRNARQNPPYKGALPALSRSPNTRPKRESKSRHNEPSTSAEFPPEATESWDPNWSNIFTADSGARFSERIRQEAPRSAGYSQEPPVSPLPAPIKFEDDATTSSGLKPRNSTEEPPARSPGGSTRRKMSTTTAKSSPFSEKNSTIMSFKQFRAEVQKWRNSSTSQKMPVKLQDFYSNAFASFKSINDTFKKRESKKLKTPEPLERGSVADQLRDPMVQQKFVGFVYEDLLESPQEVQKMVLKGTINCLLNEWRGAKSENEIRAYFILLQNPLFSRSSTYVIYAHLLRQVATLPEKDHILLTHWLRRLSTPRFRPIVERIHQFVTVRLFPDKSSKQQEIPPMTRCPWWIPSAMRVLTLLYNANNLVKPRLISYREFYNTSLDHIDTMAEFKQWINPASHPGFTFCEYPYALSLCAKRLILRRDQERQMVQIARDELVASVRRRPTRPPDVNQLFLNIKVRRQYLLQDSLSQIYGKRRELKKKLKVEFIGEPGFDMGGLTKEWFLLLLRQVLSPDYGTFVHNDKTRTYWFATSENENFSDYFLVGVLMGLAIYNCITLDLRFPLVLYRKLLSPPQLPPSVLGKSADGVTPTPIGLVSVTLDDLKDIDVDLLKGLEELLAYEGDVEEDFGVSFQIAKEEFGILHSHLLKPAGGKVAVTNFNRREYVQTYLNWLINKAVYRQFSAFYQGFHTVCDSNALSLLCAEEVETLACGNPVFDLRDLKKYTTYEGFAPNDPTILHFWDVTLSMQRDMQKKLLHFCTGSDRVPIGGMQDLKFKIIKAPMAQNMLPMAHTCFNQLLLPPYGSRVQLEQKLTIAVSNAEGFGLE